MDLKTVIEAGTEGATSLIETAAQAVEDVGELAAQVVAAVKEGSDSAAGAADQASSSLPRAALKPLLIGAAALAAVGASLLVWKRRKAAADADLSGEVPWAEPLVADVTAGEAGVVPEAEKSYADQIDEVADALAEDVIEAVETPEGGVKGV